jgi:hypothetical protein
MRSVAVPLDMELNQSEPEEWEISKDESLVRGKRVLTPFQPSTFKEFI